MGSHPRPFKEVMLCNVHPDHLCRIVAAAFLILSWNTPLQPHLERRHWHLPNDFDTAGNNSRSKSRLPSGEREEAMM
jgi:hypothetical protein